jgi:NitT/TauT family transport system permease protein
MNSLAKPAGWEKFFWPLLAAGLLLALWHYSVVWTATKVFPSPLSVEKGLAQLLHKHVLWADIGDSLRRVALGFGAGGRRRNSPGLDPGLVSGVEPGGESGDTDPSPHQPHRVDSGGHRLFRCGRSSSRLFDLSQRLLSDIGRLRQRGLECAGIFRRAGRNFGLSPTQILARVVFPAALPQILIGLRIALGVAWLVVVAAEMIAVDSGLGYLVIDSRNSGKRYDLVVAAMLVIGLIGLALDLGFRRLEKIRSVRWGFRHES